MKNLLKLTTLLIMMILLIISFTRLAIISPVAQDDILDVTQHDITETSIATETEQVPAAVESEPAAATIRARAAAPQRTAAREQNAPVVDRQATATSDFYQTIIDINLFRQLGYRPPSRAPSYSLIGTNVAEQEDVETTAVILEHSSNQQHTVHIGQQIGKNVLVKEIKPKQVILQDGDKVITLEGPQIRFLNNR